MMENNLLLKKLRTRYPNELPDKEVTPYELGALIGQQEIVVYISTLLKEKEQDDEQIRK